MIIQLMKNRLLLSICLLLISSSNFAQTPQVPKADADAIFKATGFSKTKYGWEGNCGIGEITTYKDLNGDGIKDAIISDADSTCYGREMVGYHIISQQKKGRWKMIVENRGTPTFLDTKGKDGWPDLINAGSGFCFAVFRWDGQEYKVLRYEYEGKTCSLR